MGLLSKVFPNRKKKFLGKIDQAINKVKHGTYNYLFMDLLKRYEREFAGLLSAAITNKLFNEKPLGKEATDFLSTNSPLIDKETARLKGNDLIGYMVANAVQTKAIIIFNAQQSGTKDMNFGKAFDTLRQLGFLKREEDILAPKMFLTKAEKYITESLRKVKYL